MRSNARFSVLFLVHFWDAFTERQLARLQLLSMGGDVYVMIDETRGAILADPIGASVISISESKFAALDFVMEPPGQVMWLNTDYCLYYFNHLFPEKYDYTFLIEYDCLCTVPFSTIVSTMIRHRVEFVGSPMLERIDHWYWSRTIEHYYDVEHQGGRLMGLTGYCRSLIDKLGYERRSPRLRQRLKTFPDITHQLSWPNNEAFIGSELKRLGAKEMPLSVFGDVSLYDWFPPTLESFASEIPGAAFVHPFLDDAKFVASVVKRGLFPGGLFDLQSQLWGRLGHCSKQAAVNMFLRQLTDLRDVVGLTALKSFCHSYTSGALELHLDAALSRPATQSSTCDRSRFQKLSADAGIAVSGLATSDTTTCTGFDKHAWWCVDLEYEQSLTEVRVHYGKKDLEVVTEPSVMLSCDAVVWSGPIEVGIYERAGLFGRCFCLVFSSQTTARFVRVYSGKPGHLTLAAVQVFL